MIRSNVRIVLALLIAPLLLSADATNAHGPRTEANSEDSIRVEYLEIVTTEVEATCDLLAKVHGVTFAAPDAALGNGRTATLASGGRISVRAPLAEHEQPVVRPYLLVDDIDAALAAAAAAGAQIAMSSTEIPGQGAFAIYILGGIQHGLWQVESVAD